MGKLSLSVHTATAARPAVKPYRINDDGPKGVRGLHLRVQPSGVKSYCVVYARNQTRTIGKYPVMTLDAARHEAKRLLGAPVEAAAKKIKTVTFGDFLDQKYGPWVLQERKAGAATLANIKAQFGVYLTKPIGAITGWNVEKFKADRLRSGTKPATVNRDLVRIKACLAKAVEWGVIAEHPLRSVKRAKGEDDSRVRYLSVPEEKSIRDALMQRDATLKKGRASGNAWRAERGRDLLAAFGKDDFADHLHPLVLLALNTGLRRGELFSLTWRAVDMQRKMITVRADTSKSGRTRHVPLNVEAIDTLKRWRRINKGDGLVFAGVTGARMTNINKSWASLMTAAKLKDFRFHDLRHHFASKLVMASVDLYTVKELLGHSDFEMTQRYAHLAPEHKAAAVERISAK
jgi:integrase